MQPRRYAGLPAAGGGDTRSRMARQSVLAIASLVMIAAAAHAADTTVWLCRPGIADDPCTPGLDTTEVSPGGGFIGVAPSMRQCTGRSP